MRKEAEKRELYKRSLRAAGAPGTAAGAAAGSSGAVAGSTKRKKLPNELTVAWTKTAVPARSFIFEDDQANTWRIFYVAVSGARKTHRASWVHLSDDEAMRELLSYGWSWRLKDYPDEQCPFTDLVLRDL